MTVLRFLLLLACASPAWADDQDVQTTAFLQAVFAQPPEPATLRLDSALQLTASSILDHRYPASRLRYWRVGQRSAWVLEEIGKEMPITVGIAVDNGAIERVRVLMYRESRGWEVKSPAFTDQFTGGRLIAENKLDQNIDGISGATLSVRALGKLARLALLLHQQVIDTAEAP